MRPARSVVLYSFPFPSLHCLHILPFSNFSSFSHSLPLLTTPPRHRSAASSSSRRWTCRRKPLGLYWRRWCGGSWGQREAPTHPRLSPPAPASTTPTPMLTPPPPRPRTGRRHDRAMTRTLRARIHLESRCVVASAGGVGHFFFHSLFL